MTLDCRLYLITPPALTDLDAFGRDLAKALSGGDVAALQIRLKDVSGRVDRAAVGRDRADRPPTTWR
jgi:thiamine-phosphate pyrophosphorylase